MDWGRRGAGLVPGSGWNSREGPQQSQTKQLHYIMFSRWLGRVTLAPEPALQATTP